MKRQITLLLLIVIIALFADNELDLGDFIIEGEGENLPDSLHKSIVADSLLGISSIDKFEYDSDPFKVGWEQKPDSKDESDSALEILVGDKTLGSLALISRNKIDTWKNIQLKGDFNRDDKDWEQAFLELIWQPEFMNHLITVNPHYLDVTSFPGDSEVWGSSLWIEPDYEMSGLIKNYWLDFGINSFTQQAQEATDFDLRSNLKLTHNNVDFSADFQLLKQSPSGSIDVSFVTGSLPFINEAGFWLAADSLHIYPSISFYGSQEITDRMTIFAGNKPELSSVSRFDEILDNPYQKTLTGSLQAKKMLNAEFGFLYKNLINFRVSYNPAWTKDARSYRYTTGTLLSVEYDDLLSHVFRVELGKQWSNFSINSLNSYSMYDKDLPYLVSFVSRNELAYSRSNMTASVEMIYETGWENEQQQSMDDRMDLNLAVSAEVLTDLWIVGRCNNLLNHGWIRYPGLPEKELNFQVGLRYHF